MLVDNYFYLVGEKRRASFA